MFLVCVLSMQKNPLDLVAAAMSPVENPLPDQVPVGRTPNRLSFDDFKKVMNSGAIIMVDILYDCNLDKSKNCKPHFKFTRVDTNDNSTSGFVWNGCLFDVLELQRDQLLSRWPVYFVQCMICLKV